MKNRPYRAGIAQLVEHRICNAGVAGSSPITSSRMGYSVIGNTADFDSAVLGPSPSTPSILLGRKYEV